MKFESNIEEESTMNLTPLIDMVFLLLIFFLVATTFARAERDNTIQLPGTDSPQPLTALPKNLIININQNGKTVVGARDYSRDELAALLGRTAKDYPDKNVLIRADERGPVKYFAEVADLCRKAGINELKIGYLIHATEGGAGQ